jgi:predicted dehydrogenase
MGTVKNQHSENSTLMMKRRKFLQTSLLSAAAFTIVPRNVLGGTGYIAPSDQITLGFIGIGKQANGVLAKHFLSIPECRIIAGSEVDKEKLNAFKEKVETSYAEANAKSTYKGCDIYKDFREIINRKDIDAVVIATPDHWHAIPAILAAQAGKDIYCEKPLSLTVKEGRAMVKAVRKHKRVFQTGSHQRSMEYFHRAAELVRNGYIGEIKKILVSVGGPPTECAQPAEKIPESLDWDMWLGPAPDTPYSSAFAPPITDKSWARWRFCEKFGGGLMTDWGAHMFDIAQWALNMDDTGPVDIYPPDENRKHLTYKYKNGLPMIREQWMEGNAIRFKGSEGTIEVSRQFLNLPENLKDKQLGPNDTRLYNSRNHYLDWLNAIKKRSMPICDVEIGHRTATICNIGNIAYKVGRPLKWDPKKEEFEKDPVANSMLSRPMRGQWGKLVKLK